MHIQLQRRGESIHVPQKEKEAAHAVGIPLLLGWLVAETADMVV